MAELKPCPFCGGKAFYHTVSIFSGHNDVGYYFSIKCEACGIEYPTRGAISISMYRGEITYTKDDRKELAAKWNTRQEEA